jgi:hypothetical protein
MSNPEKCNENRAFQCGDTKCISTRLVCDKYVDCLNGDDEASCEHIYQTCDDVLLDGLTEDGIYFIGMYDLFSIYSHDKYARNIAI